MSAIDARDHARVTRALPVMDLGPFLAGEPGALEALAAQWRHVCENLGFLCIVNHGVPRAELDAMEREVRRFHALPDAAKLAIRVNEHQRGFIPSKATIVKHSTYEKHTKLDTVECLVLATDYPADHPESVAGKQFYGKNPWPADLPGLREAVTGYMATIEKLGLSLLPVWARALDLPADFFAPYFREPYCYIRLAKYPKTDFVADQEFGLGAHADTGFMTFLPPAAEEGLQVLDENKVWFWPQVPAGAIIVNTGQFLSRWTNGRFRATPHRVLPPKHTDRYSFACFVNTSLDVVAECLPTCTSAANPPQHEPQSYWSFFEWYMRNTYTHYGSVGADAEEAAA
jgi:isopenicillin N synthase-like dioxygenase